MLIDDINFINYVEKLVGESHPIHSDTLNRGIKELIAKFENGDADTQVTRNHIKIESPTDITVGVTSDDIVYWDEVTSKWIKAVDKADGIIDVEKQIVYIYGITPFKTVTDLVPGTEYYLSALYPGEYTSDNDSGILIGRAFTNSTFLNILTGGGGNYVSKTGNETIAGVKTFSSNIIGNITGNAELVTNGVYTTGNQTIAGVKTFSSSPIVPTPTSGTHAANMDYVDANIEADWVANDSRAKTALNASGTAPIYACRAWVNFNGTGTVAIRASGNVSSITDRGKGRYTVNFIENIEDEDYSVGLASREDTLGNDMLPNIRLQKSIPQTSSSVAVSHGYMGTSNGPVDAQLVSVQVFR